MDQPYFATYTGCDDLFLVCQRDPLAQNPRILFTFPTMEAAQLNANDRNVDQLVHQITVLNEQDSAGYSNGETLLKLMALSEKLTDLLKWDLGGYRIERDREAALEAAKAAAPRTEAAAD